MDLDDLDYIVTAVGTGGTYTGLLVGKKLFNSTVSIYGFAVSRLHPTMSDDVLREAKATADFYRLPIQFSQADSHISFDYVGEGYDIPSAGGTEAIKQVAREEAVLLDPVYTAKAMAGLLDYVKTGKIPQGSKVLFWHTGGLPALFAEEKLTGPVYQE
jgi:D-cysteine desulfhydrase/L-cysteate sulfo-lyase